MSDWDVSRGSLRPAGACGAYLAATDATPGSFSYLELLYRKPLHAPLDVEVTWRRIGPEAGKPSSSAGSARSSS